jgi:hypothetical protein
VERVAAGVGQAAAWVPGAEREKADSLGMLHAPSQRC